MLSKKAKDAFRRIYEKEFGESLADDQVVEMGTRLLRFLDLLTRRTDDKPSGPAEIA